MKFITPILFATLFVGASANTDVLPVPSAAPGDSPYECTADDLGDLDPYMIEKVGKTLIDRPDNPFPFGEVFFANEKGAESLEDDPFKLVAKIFLEFNKDKLEDSGAAVDNGWPCPVETGWCVNADNIYPDRGVKKINSINGNTEEAQRECLQTCLDHEGATGCQVIWDQENRGCYIMTGIIDHGNGSDLHLCWLFNEKYDYSTCGNGDPILRLVGGFQEVYVNVPEDDEDCGANGKLVAKPFFQIRQS